MKTASGENPLKLRLHNKQDLQWPKGFWRDAISRVQALDPNWKPTPGLYETIEGQIADLEAQTQEAQNRLSELASLGIGPGPFAGESIPAWGPSRNFTHDERAEINIAPY